MIEFDAGQMSEKDLVDAANSIFRTEEEDFERIKNEKWYQSLFHAITLNQDGKKYAVKGIHSLAKLQQLFLNIYIKNYRESHEQLDAVIDAVIKNSEAIKRLYGACILKFEEQVSLSALDVYDSEILGLFLGEYRNDEGVVPEDIKKYNRGVLKALQQHVPTGKLDDHQIRKLKNPKVVYRCFMEQCAVDGTIETQEWPDNIYEDLRDFELSENSKKEIKDAVKRELEIAGRDYFFVKYSNNSDGVAESDFEIDDNSCKKDASEKKCETLIDQLKLKWINGGSLQWLSINFLREKLFNQQELTELKDYDLEKEVAAKRIRAKVLRDSIDKSLNHTEDGFVYAYKFGNETTNNDNQYFFIATVDGFFFFVDGLIAFVDYYDLFSTRGDLSQLLINTREVKWYTVDGVEESGSNEITIKGNEKNRFYLSHLRYAINKIIEIICGDSSTDTHEYEVSEIIEKYIKSISKDSTSKAYLVDDFRYDDKNRNKLKNALRKYASGVREDDVIGFIDTSLFGNGGSGILFAKEGIAFDYAFEKLFANYTEIQRVAIKKGKELCLYGAFRGHKDLVSNPTISGTYFDLNALKDCLEEIKYEVG